MPTEHLPALLLDDDAAVEAGVIVDGVSFTTFDLSKAQTILGYAVNGRLHAVLGSDGETLYGKLTDKVVTRPDGGWIVSWWLDKDDPLGRAKSDIGPADKTSINAEAVQIDDTELLGTSGRKPGTPAPLNWSAGVTGGLAATVLGPLVSLRPHQVERNGGVVIFREQSPSSGAASGENLTIRWNYAAPDTKQQLIDKSLTLHANAELLMDAVADGAWEVGSPLWIRTAGGFVRWHCENKEGRLPYRAAAESRTVDVTGWLPAMLPGGFARLLLDASGAKTLTIDTASRIASLEIQDPALMIALPRACCNGRDLTVPLLPPDAAAMTDTLCIVSQALVPTDMLCTAAVGLEWIDASTAQLVLSAPRPDGDTQYFAPADNWVRPAESAANCAAGLSRARVLLPHPIDPKSFRLVLGDHLTATGVGDFDSKAATSVALPSVEGKLRSVCGPLARFDIQSDRILPKPAHYGREIWPSPRDDQPPREETSNEPAVLRSLYRRSSAQGAFAIDSLPPYTATRVVGVALDTPKLARRPIEKPDTRWHQMWVAPNTEETRLRFAPKDPNSRRGWVDGVNFIGRIRGTQGPIDYFEFDGDIHASNWLRLSNDMLVSRKAALSAADANDPTTREYHQGQANRLANDPLVTELGERDTSEERGSLSLFILEETLPAVSGDSPRFVLRLKCSSGQVPVKIAFESPKDLVVVNRLVIAVANPKLGETQDEQDAGQKPKKLDDDPCDLELTKLNRLYLELEREGGQFIVRRGMVGWNASKAFGLLADGVVGLEVTEMFERRKDGALSRTVEFNGALSVIPFEAPISEEVGLNNQTYCLTVLCWAALWKYDAEVAAATLRIIGYHGWTHKGDTKWFASIQDARVAGGRLDLSADLAVMEAKTAGANDPLGTGSSWQAVRRQLYSVKLDTPLGAGGKFSNKIAGFLTLRHAAKPRFRVKEDNKPRNLGLIPDWRATERDIVPLFSDLPRPARPERLTWLRPTEGQEQRLNAGIDGDSPGKELDVKLHAFTLDVQPGIGSKLFACCLVGEIGRKQGIPRWVPAPLQGGGEAPATEPTKPAGAPADTPARMCRLWLFDGPPRMVDEWLDEWQEGNPLLDPRRPDKVAKKTLARLGWTREAVLEIDPGTGSASVEWTVVDSPLLNREASIGWFGWPLRAHGDTDKIAVLPQDILPRTRPVPQFEAKAPRAFSIEVVFEDDRPPGAEGSTPAVASPLLVDLAPTDLAANVAVPIKLRSAGLRVGAWHRFVDYDQEVIKGQMFAPEDLPAFGTKDELVLHSKTPGILLFKWGERSVEDTRIAPTKDGTPENSCLLEVPTEASLIRVIQSDEDLVIFNQNGLCQKVDRTTPYDVWPPDPKGAKRLGIRMPPGKPFKTLVVEFCTMTEGKLVVLEQRKYFDGGSERLAGLFNNDQQLQAFGSEQVVFYLGEVDVSAPDSPKLKWQRVAEYQYSIYGDVAAAGWYIATVDIEGRLTYYFQ